MVESALPKPRRVLYVVSRFPCLSTTFTVNEMAVVASEGVEVFVAPVWKILPGTVPHDVEKPFLSKIVRMNLRSVRTWTDVFQGLFRNPWGVLRLIATLIPGHLRSPYLPLKLLVAIPKGLYLGRWCLDNKIDHIHAHFLTSPTTVAMIASEVSGVPYSYTAHAFDITSQHPKHVNGSITAKCQRAALGVTISRFNHRYILQQWPEVEKARLEVVYNGVDTDLFTPADPIRPPSATRDATGYWRVLSVGRLCDMKGHEYLIQAVASLRNKGIEVRLDIFGDGELKGELQQLIDSLGTEHIRLRGTLLQGDLVKEYQQAGIFALASVPSPWGYRDGLPTVLIEALAMELPTVSTHLSGIPEIIQHQVTGLCVPPGDVQRLADAIEWIISHPEEAKAMGRRGRQLVLERFDRRKNAKQLLALWRDIHTRHTATARE